MPAPSWTADDLDALNRLTTVARLLSTAVHDSGNALQIISGNAEMLAARPEDAEKTRLRARTIQTHADETALRLRALAALSRPETAPPVTIGLRAAAERAVALRRYTLNRQQIAVTIGQDRADVRVRVPETTLLRLIANLVLHAEDRVAGQPGGSIRINVGSADGVATLHFLDSAKPLDAAERAALFVPFGRPADPWAGLPAAHALATGLGGTLVAEPSADDGLALVLCLPVGV